MNCYSRNMCMNIQTTEQIEIAQLKEQIARLEKKIDELSTQTTIISELLAWKEFITLHLQYMPHGDGYEKAKENYIKLSKQQ